MQDPGLSSGARLLIPAGAAVADVEELPALIRRLVETASETPPDRSGG